MGSAGCFFLTALVAVFFAPCENFFCLKTIRYWKCDYFNNICVDLFNHICYYTPIATNNSFQGAKR
nr:MAG TPA: hypothetical protein [Caudoviricetes sp.]